jgi:hypothetical protein
VGCTPAETGHLEPRGDRHRRRDPSADDHAPRRVEERHVGHSLGAVDGGEIPRGCRLTSRCLGAELPGSDRWAVLQWDVVDESKRSANDWPTVQGDVSDEAQALIADLVPDFSGPGKISRPLIHPRWEIANSIM